MLTWTKYSPCARHCSKCLNLLSVDIRYLNLSSPSVSSQDKSSSTESWFREMNKWMNNEWGYGECETQKGDCSIKNMSLPCQVGSVLLVTFKGAWLDALRIVPPGGGAAGIFFQDSHSHHLKVALGVPALVRPGLACAVEQASLC